MFAYNDLAELEPEFFKSSTLIITKTATGIHIAIIYNRVVDSCSEIKMLFSIEVETLLCSLQL